VCACVCGTEPLLPLRRQALAQAGIVHDAPHALTRATPLPQSLVAAVRVQLAPRTAIMVRLSVNLCACVAAHLTHTRRVPQDMLTGGRTVHAPLDAATEAAVSATLREAVCAEGRAAPGPASHSAHRSRPCWLGTLTRTTPARRTRRGHSRHSGSLRASAAFSARRWPLSPALPHRHSSSSLHTDAHPPITHRFPFDGWLGPSS
jgi:hypothetical protein